MQRVSGPAGDAHIDVFDAIHDRRSCSRLLAPAPSAGDLRRIVEAAVAAPDHGRLRPWRFVALTGAAKDAFGDVLAEAYVRRVRAEGGEPDAGTLAKERTKLERAPMVLVVGAVRRETTKVPWTEQYAAAVAAAQNALLAATALGYGSMWRTGDPAYDDHVKAALGLGPDDAVVAFLYLGTAPPDAPRPARTVELDDVFEVRA